MAENKIDSALQSLLLMANMEVIWKNASPGSPFPPQNLILDLRKHSLIYIFFSNDRGQLTFSAIRKGDNTRLWNCSNTINRIPVNVQESKIIFGQGEYLNMYGEAAYTKSNGVCIPELIIGKEVNLDG